MKILFATSNPAKVNRFEQKLNENGVEVLTLKDINCDLDVEENGKDAIENALIKARAYYKETGLTVISMDDTLYLENVPDDKQPGMYVRRVNGKRLDDDEMIEYYTNLAHIYGDNGILTARWVYGMAVINDGKEYTYTWSKNDFNMFDVASTTKTPGYPLNSVSKCKGNNKYFSEMTKEEVYFYNENENHVVEFILNSIKNN